MQFSRKEKTILIALSICAFVCLVFFLVLSVVSGSKEEAVPVYAPSAGLSQSVFSYQNMQYIANESYPKTHQFEVNPFAADTVEGQVANVGNGYVYAYEPYYFYYSEYVSGSVEEVLKAELTSILDINAQPALTQVDVLSKQEGFVNGCDGIFYCIRLTTGTQEAPVVYYLCLYELKVNETNCTTQGKLLIGCMAQNMYSTEGLAALQTLALDSVYTLKISPKEER